MNVLDKLENPIVVGLAGKAATGKTSVAESIVPKAAFASVKEGFVWDHIFFAMPLYEFYSIRTKIEGLNSESRKLYAIHEVLYELYGSSPIGNIPQYNDLVKLTNEILHKGLMFSGSKPRSFLQEVGDMCRQYDQECFAKWGVRKAKQLHKEYVKSISEEDQQHPHCVLISDVRFENEAEAILSQPNGMLIVYDADPEVRKERILMRDGVMMTEEQMSHKSEKQIDLFIDKASVVIDSSSMTIEEQVMATVESIRKYSGN
jgi:dephospho-CoA kinase